ncbi:glycosyltransferase [Okeania sp. SIO2B3]|uniref:glycosyltransferase n=1 Tax=Okeania sp. SIO2B3 TaxID=2607784 RepID=UPI0013C2018B|nr:glycosyltransferase [Okeania sp. SIO2B3]NET45662.1 glycosyl transferase family 1 [Okeania sp. SIO2B3]
MSNIGILCPPAIGHLNPMANLGNELQKRGNKVTLFGVPDVREKMIGSGLDFFEIGAKDFPLGSIDSISSQLGELTGFEGLKYVNEYFRKETSMLFRESPDAIAKVGANALLVDQTILAGGTIADYMNLPFINICNALPSNREPGIPPSFTHWPYRNNWWTKLRNQLCYQLLGYLTRSMWSLVPQQRKDWKLPPYQKQQDFYSQLCQISQLPKALDFPREQLVPWFHHVGPFKNTSDTEPVSFVDQDFSFEKLNSKPLIYANLGTIQNRNRMIFQCIAQACSELEIEFQLLISLGNPNADVSQVNFPGSPLVFSFPPHQKIINRSHLVITHAGSTALNCLSVGVPMVAIPITTDQPGMAARIAQAGAGEVIPLKKLNVSAVKTSIEKVFREPSYRNNAAKIAAAIQKAGGVEYAADLIEQAISTGKPVLATT